MTILALDQATKTSGWSIWEDGKLITYGKWTHEESEIATRIHGLCQQIESKIKEFHVSLVVMENIQLQSNVGNNVDVFQKLAWVQGAIILLCMRLGIPHKILSSNTWRAKCHFLVGNARDRATQKKIAQDWCLKTFGKKCTQDEADAICIGYAASMDETDSFDWS